MKKYNVVVATDIGSFIINRNDIGVGWQLSQYGTYDPLELNAVKELMKILRSTHTDLVALDIGSNIGIHSVILSNEVGVNGRVYAFEAQRIIFNMLAGNVALNSLNNVFCYHNAVTDVAQLIDIPQFDYGKQMGFGSVEFGGKQIETIGQTPINDPKKQEKVPGIAIDDMNFPQVHFMKIDVEGMEINVLKGAAKTINAHRPFMLVEHLKSDKEELISWFNNANYSLYSGVGANYVCIPKENGLKISGLTPVP